MIDHVGESMIPATQLGPVREDLAQRRPDPQVFHRPPWPAKVAARCPLSIANTTLRPSRKAPTITSSAALLSSRPALTYRPSAQAYTTSRLSSRRLRHPSNSSCHFARSRSIDEAESGAPSPSSPRNASSKSPWASPWRENCASSLTTCSDRLTKNVTELRY